MNIVNYDHDERKNSKQAKLSFSIEFAKKKLTFFVPIIRSNFTAKKDTTSIIRTGPKTDKSMSKNYIKIEIKFKVEKFFAHKLHGFLSMKHSK